MTTCILGVVVWKALEAKIRGTRTRLSTDIQNLAHSLAEHAAHTFRLPISRWAAWSICSCTEIPYRRRFNKYLAATGDRAAANSRDRRLDTDGNWRYSSLPETPRYNNGDRPYFAYHRDHADKALRVSEPLQSRLTGRPTILLSRRVTKEDGSFGGVLTAAIDSDYFSGFYRAFQLGPDGGISLLRNDGRRVVPDGRFRPRPDLSRADLFTKHLKLSSVGYYKITSPFDGILKYFGYEGTPQYPLVVTVAMSEDWLLSAWSMALRTDALVAAVLLCMIILLAALLSAAVQFSDQNRARAAARASPHYRLLADNIADVVILLNGRGTLRYVSHSVEQMLGVPPAGSSSANPASTWFTPRTRKA